MVINICEKSLRLNENCKNLKSTLMYLKIDFFELICGLLLLELGNC